MPGSSANWAPDRRDIIWIEFSPESGLEIKDEHPMVVLSTRAFNEKTGIVIGLPLTHSPLNETNPFAVKYEYTHAGAKKVGYVLTHQPKSFDWRARNARAHPLKTMPTALFDLARDGLNQIIQLA